MKVFMNPSPFDDPGDIPEMPYADTIAVNEYETALLLGASSDEITDWLDAAKRLCEKYKVKNAEMLASYAAGQRKGSGG